MLGAATQAAEAPAPGVGGDPDLPQRVEPGEIAPLMTASPFTRSLNLSDSLVLTGIAYIEGKPVATLMNKETKESYVVGETPNSQGWRLAETSATVKLDRTQAKIMIGTEVVPVRYSDAQLTPEAMKKGEHRPGGTSDGRSEERRYDGPRRDGPRPSEEDRQRFFSLSEEGRRKFMDRMRESGDRLRMASPEERQAYVRNVMERIQKEEQESKR